MKRFYLFVLLLIGLHIIIRAQTNRIPGTGTEAQSSYNDSNPLAVIPLPFITLDTNQVKALSKNALLNIKFKNIICYQDTVDDQTVWIAYKLKDKKKWISFPTPFLNRTSNFQMTAIDKKGQPELVVTGDIAYEPWPSGERLRDAYIVYNIDSIPTQILNIQPSIFNSNFSFP